MTPANRIPAAAPAWVRSLVAGPETAARVVHPGADAVYLDVDGSCVGVLSTAATAVPCGVRTALPALPADLLGETAAHVGGGRVLLGSTEVVVARTVDASVPPLRAEVVSDGGETLAAVVGERVDHVRAELPAEALDALVSGDPDAVPSLLGRGSGLTPVGDDVLAGWLATTVAASRAAAVPTPAAAAPTGAVPGAADESPVALAVAVHAATSTTLLSATLLDCARRGDVIPQFRTLLQTLPRALAAQDRDRLDEAVSALLRVGHTSGAGLMLGTVLALRHLASRSPS